MKLINVLTLGLLTSASLYAQTTMCFKENHLSMATIESTSLDGGLCSSSKSVKDMKNEGWSVDDIKITSGQNGNNYIYIFKKDEQKISSFDEEKIEQKILAKLEKRKKEEIEIKKKEVKFRMFKSGKELYINKCQTCHGEKADKKAHNTSRPLVNLNYDDMKIAIRDYTLDQYDRGRAIVMKPYANMLNTKKIKEVYSYIQTLKPKKEEEAK